MDFSRLFLLLSLEYQGLVTGSNNEDVGQGRIEILIIKVKKPRLRGVYFVLVTGRPEMYSGYEPTI